MGSYFYDMSMLFSKQMISCADFKNSERLIRALGSSVKIIRNLIFHKVSTRRKGFISDLQQIFEITVLSREISADMLRILCRLSENDKLASKMGLSGGFEQTIAEVLRRYKDDHYVVSSSCMLMNNIVGACGVPETLADSECLKQLVDVFEHYTAKANANAESMEDMLKSFASFEFVSAEDQDIIEKILTILANFFTSEKNAQSFMTNSFAKYKLVLKSLRFFINEHQLPKEVPSSVVLRRALRLPH